MSAAFDQLSSELQYHFGVGAVTDLSVIDYYKVNLQSFDWLQQIVVNLLPTATALGQVLMMKRLHEYDRAWL